MMRKTNTIECILWNVCGEMKTTYFVLDEKRRLYTLTIGLVYRSQIHNLASTEISILAIDAVQRAPQKCWILSPAYLAGSYVSTISIRAGRPRLRREPNETAKVLQSWKLKQMIK